MKLRAVSIAQILTASMMVGLAICAAACSSAPKASVVTNPGGHGTGRTPVTSKTKGQNGTTSTSNSTTSTAKAGTTCTATELTYSSTRGQGAAGTVTFSIQMKNQTSAPCTLEGYPGMQLVGSNGGALPTDVVRGGVPPSSTGKSNAPPSLVTLGPGTSATVAVSYEDVSVDNQGVCPTSASVEITPPNAYDHGTLPLAIAPCGGGMLHVSPVYRPS